MAAGRTSAIGTPAAPRNTARLFTKAGTLLADIEDYLAKHTKAHPIYEGQRLIGLAAESIDEMDQVVEFLTRECQRVPGFQFMRNTIYVRFCHEAYSKGTALGELARLTGITRDEIFAAGDHYNDLPMLDGRHAAWVACPGNAVEVVKRTVSDAGGLRRRWRVQRRHRRGPAPLPRRGVSSCRARFRYCCCCRCASISRIFFFKAEVLHFPHGGPKSTIDPDRVRSPDSPWHPVHLSALLPPSSFPASHILWPPG